MWKKLLLFVVVAAIAAAGAYWYLDREKQADRNGAPGGHPSVEPTPAATSPASAEPGETSDPGRNSDAEIRAIMDRMTLSEKIGQMMIVGVAGTDYDDETDSLIHDYKVGGFLFNKHNLATAADAVRYLNRIKRENAANPLPVFLGIDQEGGRVSKLPEVKAFPPSLDVGATNDPRFANRIGIVTGTALRRFGFNMNFAPVLDIHSNPQNPVIGDRSFGSDADLVSRLGIETMKGLQAQQVISVVKHFPGHGDTSVDSHLELPVVNKSRQELDQLELIPFRRAVGEGADAVMIAHILLPKLDPEYPSSLSHEMITGLLREQLQFDGVVVTDDLTMDAIAGHYDMGKAAVLSIKAGSDLIMIAHGYDRILAALKAVHDAVTSGEIPEERIDASVERIIRLKWKYGLEDTELPMVDVDELNRLVEETIASHLD